LSLPSFLDFFYLIKHDLLQDPMLAAPTSLPEMIMQTLQSGIAKTCFPASAPPAK
jgi:hypothetical protein